MSQFRNRNGHAHPDHDLADALHDVIRNAEGLLKETTTQTEHTIQEARSRASKSLHEARARLEAAEGKAVDGARKLVGDAEKYARRNPWRAVGVAAAAGLVVGMLIGRE